MDIEEEVEETEEASHKKRLIIWLDVMFGDIVGVIDVSGIINQPALCIATNQGGDNQPPL